MNIYKISYIYQTIHLITLNIQTVFFFGPFFHKRLFILHPEPRPTQCSSINCISIIFISCKLHFLKIHWPNFFRHHIMCMSASCPSSSIECTVLYCEQCKSIPSEFSYQRRETKNRFPNFICSLSPFCLSALKMSLFESGTSTSLIHLVQHYFYLAIISSTRRCHPPLLHHPYFLPNLPLDIIHI